MNACVRTCVSIQRRGRERREGETLRKGGIITFRIVSPILFPSFPSVFQHVPSLAVRDRSIPQLAEEYRVSKQRRPVCGGIILNKQLDKVGKGRPCCYGD